MSQQSFYEQSIIQSQKTEVLLSLLYGARGTAPARMELFRKSEK
jgi:hypothetical protein